VASWPGEARRTPPPGTPTAALLRPLSDWIRAEAEAIHAERGSYRLLDVGCGVKPYYPWFEPYVSEYVGLDIEANEAADVHGTIEAIPLEDASFDAVLCSQVLEHCDDPAQGVRELRRVVKPGGRVLLSTHGTMVYHPNPVDLWRWTGAGLERLFRENGDWASVTVSAGSGTASSLTMLNAIYLEHVLRRTPLRPLRGVVVSTLNRVARAIDRRATVLRDERPGTLAANYHVVADRAA
jgi:SAM-dependent methyltransferase